MVYNNTILRKYRIKGGDEYHNLWAFRITAVRVGLESVNDTSKHTTNMLCSPSHQDDLPLNSINTINDFFAE